MTDIDFAALWKATAKKLAADVREVDAIDDALRQAVVSIALQRDRAIAALESETGRSSMTHQSTQEVEDALKAIPADMPFRDEILAVLHSAASEAHDDELYWEEEGKPHLRTFLKTTLLGGAILELARAINAKAQELPEAEYPKFFSTEMDNGFFVKTLEQPADGHVFVHKGKRWVVKYSWLWARYAGIPVYCAELKPINEEAK